MLDNLSEHQIEALPNLHVDQVKDHITDVYRKHDKRPWVRGVFRRGVFRREIAGNGHSRLLKLKIMLPGPPENV
jgi:phosphopantetheine adenylyltransferase